MSKRMFMATILIDTVAVAFVLTMITLCIHGCGSGLQVADPFMYDSNCTVYSDLGIDIGTTDATIPKVIKNPCAAQNIIATTAKTGVMLNAYQVSEFVKWANATKDFIMIGMPFIDIKECVGTKIPELNNRLGIQYVTMSDILEAIPGESTVTRDDLMILMASIDDLIEQVNAMKKDAESNIRRYVITQRFKS